jgi:hypothetical protein
MFDPSNTFKARIAGGIDLLIDVATLGEYGLEEVDAMVTETVRDRHAVRSHTSAVNPLPAGRQACTAASRHADRKVVELDRFLRPAAVEPAGAKAKAAPVIAGHATTLAPVIPINASVAAGDVTPVNQRVASRQACPEGPGVAPGYTPCTPAAKRLALTAA